VAKEVVRLGGELVEQYIYLLGNIVLQDNVIDKWKWNLDPSEGYSVRGVYKLLTYVM